MGAHGPARNAQPQTPETKPLPWIRVPLNPASIGSPLHSDPDSSMEAVGDIVHEESDSMRLSRVKPAKRALNNDKSPRKRPAPTARKDEWEDSSDEEEGNRVTESKHKNSTYFHSGLENSPSSKGRAVAKSKGAEAKGLSGSKTAVDFRNRREVEQSYRKKISAMIDDDILERVNAEGGITPAGRMYKAVYQMMKRRKGNEWQAGMAASHEEAMQLRAENRALREKIDEATRLLRST